MRVIALPPWSVPILKFLIGKDKIKLKGGMGWNILQYAPDDIALLFIILLGDLYEMI
ncbi:MAG: hypothetical protein AAF843_01220 [Bacteroidota bacterium]